MIGSRREMGRNSRSVCDLRYRYWGRLTIFGDRWLIHATPPFRASTDSPGQIRLDVTRSRNRISLATRCISRTLIHSAFERALILTTRSTESRDRSSFTSSRKTPKAFYPLVSGAICFANISRSLLTGYFDKGYRAPLLLDHPCNK